MITNQFVLDILDIALDVDADGLALRDQIPFLTEDGYDYTGHGVFIGFKYEDGIEPFRLKNRGGFVLDEVELKSSELSIGALVLIHAKEGLVNYIEVWSYEGSYPKHELTDYVITQKWEGAKRQIKKPA